MTTLLYGCGWGITTEEACTGPGDFHILIAEVEPGVYKYSASCQDHLTLVITNGAIDWHRVGHECYMPSAIWDSEEGECVVPDEENFMEAIEVTVSGTR